MSQHKELSDDGWAVGTYTRPCCQACGAEEFVHFLGSGRLYCFRCIERRTITPAIAALLADFAESQLGKLPPEKDRVYREALAELRGMR